VGVGGGLFGGGLCFVLSWRCLELFVALGRPPAHAHWPAWVAFNRAMKDRSGDVGIWHETYLVSAGRYEAVYSGVPRQGLGAAGRIVDAAGKRETARGRVAAPLDRP
ncbi:monooxygenase family protein, partial [Elioraea sp.]|uniref:monooxygenase family protein n=1 Tax=Elioraea sp. TaxID=2185103 RepID=UPI003F6F1E26